MTNGFSCNVSTVSSFPSLLDYIERNTFRSKPCSNFDSGEISLAVERVCWPIGSFLPKKADIRIHTLLYSIYRTFEINVKIIKMSYTAWAFYQEYCTVYILYTIKTTELVRNLALDMKEFSGIALAEGLNVLLSIHLPLRESMRWAGHSSGIPSTYFCCQKNVRLTGFHSVCTL